MRGEALSRMVTPGAERIRSKSASGVVPRPVKRRIKRLMVVLLQLPPTVVPSILSAKQVPCLRQRQTVALEVGGETTILGGVEKRLGDSIGTVLVAWHG